MHMERYESNILLRTYLIHEHHSIVEVIGYFLDRYKQKSFHYLQQEIGYLSFACGWRTSDFQQIFKSSNIIESTSVFPDWGK